MAVTAHYIVRADDGKLKLRHRLVAFRVVHGTHDGKHLAEVFLRVLKEIRALERVRSDHLVSGNSLIHIIDWWYYS